MSAENKKNGVSAVLIEKGGVHDYLTILLAGNHGICDAKREALPDGRSVIRAHTEKGRLIEALRQLNMKPLLDEKSPG